MILNNIYSTKELIIIFIKAEYLALKYNNNFIMPIHLILGLLLTNNLCTKLLNINKTLINNKLLKLLLKRYKYNINVTNIIFSNKVINILLILNKLNYKVNSLNLFLILLKEQDKDIKFLFKYLNLNTLYNNINNYINTEILPSYYKYKLNEIAINILNIKPLYNYNIENTYQYKQILQILNVNIKKHIIIKGDTGIGKFSFLRSLANNIKIKNVPIYLYNTEIWILKLNLLNLDIQDIISKILFISKYFINTSYKLILIIQNIDIFDNINTIDNNNLNSKLYYLNVLLNQINNYNIHIILSLDTNKYNFYFNTINKNIESFFYKIQFKELSNLKHFLIIKKNLYKYIKYYKINITDYIIYELINLSKKYIKTINLPKAPLILLEYICSKSYLINNKLHNYYFNYFNTYNNKITLKIENNLTINHIKQAISDYLNISKIYLFKNNKITKTNIIKLEQKLHKTIYGQNHIFKNIIPAIKQNLIGLKTKNKPIGSWILCGPSGTGKTELAKTLAKQLFGSEKELIRFDMSEYMEKHSISRLIGSPPGYIGYAEGGQLTEQVYKKPNSVILFDEIEKAHPDIYNIMLQILDEGRLTDSTGKLIDFTNTIILLTSNLGCPKTYDKYLMNKNYLSNIDLKEIEKHILININNYFKPELLNRLTNILIFNPLNIDDLLLICDKFINEIKNKLYIHKLNILIYIQYNIKYMIVKLSYNPLYGARPLKRFLELFIEKSISDLLLYYNKNYFMKHKYILYYFLNKYYNLNYNIYLI
nr:caseinolytic protease C [Haemoproteus belopolskyi]